MEPLKVFKVRNVKTPVRGTSKSAGIDFFIPEGTFKSDNGTKTLWPNEDILIPSGICAKIPEGYMLMAADKSGISPSTVALKKAGMKNKVPGLASTLLVGAKIIDEDYPGEIHMHVVNVGNTPCALSNGMKLVQFILVPVSYADVIVVDKREDLGFIQGERTGGFSSTVKEE